MKSAERRADAASFHAVIGADSTRAFDSGLAHHRAGRLAEAETCYREVLAAEPNHLRALHLLGCSAIKRAGKTRQPNCSIELLRETVQMRGCFPILASS
jgi:hypothetical protein